MKELIEKLKDKNYVRAFGLMKPEEQKCLEEANGKNGVIVLLNSGWEPGNMAFDCPHLTYCIKPDYKPEFVDYLIEVCDGEDGDESDLKSFLGVKHKLDNNPILPREHTYLYALSSLPNFEGFYNKKTDGETRENITWIATLISEGKKIYARFRNR